MVPYSVYLPGDYHRRLKEMAKDRKASSLVREAIIMIMDGSDAYRSGYSRGVSDAAKVVFDCKEAQMVAVRGKDIGAILTELIQDLDSKQ